jgi:hypothetical protein
LHHFCSTHDNASARTDADVLAAVDDASPCGAKLCIAQLKSYGALTGGCPFVGVPTAQVIAAALANDDR